MTKNITIIFSLLALFNIAYAEPSSNTNDVDGVYTSKYFSFVVASGNYYPVQNNIPVLEKKSTCFIENGLLYLRVYFPPGQEKPPADIVLVYEITKTGLTALRIEDYKSKRTYEDHAEKPILVKSQIPDHWKNKYFK